MPICAQQSFNAALRAQWKRAEWLWLICGCPIVIAGSTEAHLKNINSHPNYSFFLSQRGDESRSRVKVAETPLASPITRKLRPNQTHPASFRWGKRRTRWCTPRWGPIRTAWGVSTLSKCIWEVRRPRPRRGADLTPWCWKRAPATNTPHNPNSQWRQTSSPSVCASLLFLPCLCSVFE